MRLEQIPVIGPLLEAGADDSVFDALLILGPIVISIITFLGRTLPSVLLAVAYTGGFLSYIAYKGVAETTESST
ncbi:hypothetical protein [Haloarcula sebkhae]|uniref:Uncharacterized protein n=2 Tax=Haloarcula sebkhae TaxID=932660 RepID=A0A830F1E1_9EURY|nr:hypothetical protein [Haloarcula sebkhae]GGK76878.1 hypothetical protein GCM10009067_31690 [Haloarcula sebkhae]